MASTFSTNLRLEYPADGEKSGTWGQVINDNITKMVEEALTGEASISTTGGTDTLTTANGTTDEARRVFIDVSGTLVSNSTIAIPDLNKMYLVRNGTAGAFTTTIKPSGTGVAVVQGETMLVYCDGTNAFEIAMGGFTVTTFAKTLLDDTTAAAMATTLVLGTGDSPQFTGIELGHASDTTLTRTSAGDVDIEGNIIYRAGGTDVPVADGGTGSSTASDARTALGVAIGSDVQADLDVVSQVDAEAGTATDERIWTAQRVSQAIAALVDSGLPTPDFTSSDQTVSNNVRLEIAHSIGAKPTLVQVVLKCTTTDLNYSVGDEIFFNDFSHGAGNRGVVMFADTTNITLVQGDDIILLDHNTPFASNGITEASWRWVVKAWT